MSGPLRPARGPEPAPAHALDEALHHAVLARVAAGGGAPRPDELAELVRGADPLLGATEVRAAATRLRARLAGLGPLEPLLADPAVTDVLVNGPGAVWVERLGALERTDVCLGRAAIDLLVEQIVGPLGRRVDPASPTVEARLADGSRVHVVVPPLAPDGPCVAIRRFGVRARRVGDFADPPVAALLRAAVRGRANVVVSGGTGAGKTTLLDALGAEVSSAERIVTIEDAAELRLPHDHVVRLEARPPSADGQGAVTIRDLVRSALRLRPDRLVVGEARGAEAFDLVQAMNTGHDGSLATVHANRAVDAVRRLEALVLLAATGLPAGAVREHVAAAIDLVVHVARGPGGDRRVVEVLELARPTADGHVGAPRPLVEGGHVVGEPHRLREARP